MLVNTLANFVRQENGEQITIEHIRAEYNELLAVKRKSPAIKQHLRNLWSYINSYEKSVQNNQN